MLGGLECGADSAVTVDKLKLAKKAARKPHRVKAGIFEFRWADDRAAASKFPQRFSSKEKSGREGS